MLTPLGRRNQPHPWSHSDTWSIRDERVFLENLGYCEPKEPLPRKTKEKRGEGDAEN